MTEQLTTTPGRVPAPATTVLICDHRPAARQALSRLVAAGPNVDVTGAVADGFALVDAFTARPADLVLIGVYRGDPGGAHALDLLLGLHPSAAAVVYGSAPHTTLLSAAITRGARGLMVWNPDQPHGSITQPAGDLAPLRGPATTGGAGDPTPRELRILQGLSHGQSYAEIGRTLVLSEDTVKSHASRLFAKLRARDRAHAVALAIRAGLLT